MISNGLARMYGEKPDDVFYYVTLYNENYVMPSMPAGVEQGIINGMYPLDPTVPAEKRAASRRSPPARVPCPI